jgi:hypothetical protein
MGVLEPLVALVLPVRHRRSASMLQPVVVVVLLGVLLAVPRVSEAAVVVKVLMVLLAVVVVLLVAVTRRVLEKLEWAARAVALLCSLAVMLSSAAVAVVPVQAPVRLRPEVIASMVEVVVVQAAVSDATPSPKAGANSGATGNQIAFAGVAGVAGVGGCNRCSGRCRNKWDEPVMAGQVAVVPEGRQQRVAWSAALAVLAEVEQAAAVVPSAVQVELVEKAETVVYMSSLGKEANLLNTFKIGVI